jgi:transposase
MTWPPTWPSCASSLKQRFQNCWSLPGVGPVVAGTILLAWSHPGRVRSEAAFAALAGTSPIPASSGNTIRYRLNRGGDRQLNRVLTTIVLVRMRRDQATRDYLARLRAEGRTTKEIVRILKRYIARQVFRLLATRTQPSAGSLTGTHPGTIAASRRASRG